MRPRISQREANYIAELLRATQPLLEGKLKRLGELRNKIARIRIEVFQVGNPYAIISEHYWDKKRELAELEREEWDLSKSVNLHTALINKYTDIANGKGPGRHKRNTHVLLWPRRFVVEMEPKNP